MSDRPWVRWAGYALLLSFTLSSLACNPVRSTARINEAEVALEQARLNEAHVRAPYEYYRATYFLHKAKEEWGYSDFEAAYDYAAVSKSAAENARLKAKENPWPGTPVPREKLEAIGLTPPPEAVRRGDPDKEKERATTGETPETGSGDKKEDILDQP